MTSRLFSRYNALGDRRRFQLMLALILVSTFLIQLFTLPCVDIAWLILGTQQMLDGAVLYRDVIDPAPPLIFWLYTPPVWLAGFLDLPPSLMLKHCIIALALLNLYVCNRVLLHSPHWQAEEKRFPLLIGIAGVLLFTPDSFIAFGQREHLLILLALPYLLSHLPSLEDARLPGRLKSLLGLMAAVSFCLKPHFFVIWFTVLAYRFATTRSLRRMMCPADAAIIGFTVCYASVVLLWHPYYFELLAMLMQTYGAHRYLHQTTLSISLWFAGLLALAFAAGVILRLFKNPLDAPYRKDMVYLALLAAGGFVEALLQFKTWEYISYPFLALAGMVFLTAIVLRPITHFGALIVMAWFFFPVTPFSDNRQDYYKEFNEALMPVLAPYKDSRDLYYLSVNFAPPQLYRHESPLRWTSRITKYAFLLDAMKVKSPVSTHVTQESKPGYEALERWLLDGIANDLEKKQPDLIAMHRIRSEPGETALFDFATWLESDATLSRLMKQYRLREEVDICDEATKTNRCLFQIYTKKVAGKR